MDIRPTAPATHPPGPQPRLARRGLEAAARRQVCSGAWQGFRRGGHFPTPEVRRVVQCKRLSCMVLRLGKVVTDDTFSRGELGTGHLEYDPCVHAIGNNTAQFQLIL